MASTEKYATLAAVTIFASGSTTAVASNSNAISATQDPTSAAYGGSGTTPGYPRGAFQLQSGATALAAVPTATTAYQIYFRRNVDGTTTGTPTTFENDPGRSVTPTQPMAVSRAADVNSTTQNLCFPPCEIPSRPFQVVLVNAATGQSLPAGWSLIFTPESFQGV